MALLLAFVAFAIGVSFTCSLLEATLLSSRLVTLDIQEMGGRTVAARQRMNKEESPDEWTEIVVQSVEFDIDLADNVFTL